LAPDYAGFRGALCDGDRRGRLDPDRLRRLRALLRA
jgi:(5-formylfuran-3-yl)methyl phosphate synthase